uniref:Calmodulin n=1 Tax=Noctiluca scintillans TaxID=2966 RepID=A0A7S1A2U1_NOCSC|mmetsp:Transcript_29569/g.78233  ORF Transcript_29569/g.78233 Transcript_29569/m.78233 type:complete len:126 (+) Transcript_29569:64-441(+)
MRSDCSCLITVICMAVQVQGHNFANTLFTMVDNDQDGILSLTEVLHKVDLQGARFLESCFVEADGNDDGFLDSREARDLFDIIAEEELRAGELCRERPRGVRCLTWRMAEIMRLRSFGVLETDAL